MLVMLFPVLIMITSGSQLRGQSANCIDSDPFCTGTNYVFPASVGAGDAEQGPDYGCLATQPNPVWYHMQIDDPGDLILEMNSTPEEDIDFICWGPFDDPSEPCVDDLTNDKIVDCSYSADPTETCTVPDSESGEYYIIMITNYSDEPCNINFFQTGGEATTDCSIVPPQSGSNSPVCEGETLQLTAADVEGATYFWTGPQGFSSTEQNPQIQNATPGHSGTYEVVIELGGIESDPSETEVVVAPSPIVDAGEDQTISFGMYTTLHGEVEGDANDFDFSWQPEALLENPTILEPQTINLEETTTFALMATNAEYGCSSSDQTTVIVEGDPLSVQIISEDEICQGEQITLQSEVLGGSGSYEYNWTSDPSGFESTSPNPEVSPTQNTTYILEVSDGYNLTTDQKLIVVHELPAADAGQDQSIPYGTSTQLLGTIEGNENDYDLTWQPEELLESADVWEPYTLQLENTQAFILTLEESETGCVGSDEVVVTVTGGPLSVTVNASEEYVCYGNQVQLTAYGSGGSGDYTFSWSSEPGGFSSTLPNPVVAPEEETTYHVVLNDGYNTTEQSLTIDVKDNPQLEVMNDTSIVYGNSLQLAAFATAGVPPYQYSWSPEDYLLENDVAEPLTTALYENTDFYVEISDSWGCESETQEVAVTIETNTLSVSVTPGNPEICFGDSVLLQGNYTGNIGQAETHWSDEEGNLLSEQQQLMVSPLASKDYYFVTEDDYFMDSLRCRVIVHENPDIGIQAEGYTIEEGAISLCVYDTVTLAASEHSYDFIWSNGAITPEIEISTSGISMDMQDYSVSANSEFGCVSNDSIMAVFTFSGCVGINEPGNEGPEIYPNPVKEYMKIMMPEQAKGDQAKIKVTSINGNVLLKSMFSDDEFIIDVKGWATGMYFVSVTFSEKVFTTSFLVK